jgi:hypothetical protein
MKSDIHESAYGISSIMSMSRKFKVPICDYLSPPFRMYMESLIVNPCGPIVLGIDHSSAAMVQETMVCVN